MKPMKTSNTFERGDETRNNDKRSSFFMVAENQYQPYIKSLKPIHLICYSVIKKCVNAISFVHISFTYTNY